MGQKTALSVFLAVVSVVGAGIVYVHRLQQQERQNMRKSAPFPSSSSKQP